MTDTHREFQREIGHLLLLVRGIREIDHVWEILFAWYPCLDDLDQTLTKVSNFAFQSQFHDMIDEMCSQEACHVLHHYYDYPLAFLAMKNYKGMIV